MWPQSGTTDEPLSSRSIELLPDRTLTIYLSERMKRKQRRLCLNTNQLHHKNLSSIIHSMAWLNTQTIRKNIVPLNLPPKQLFLYNCSLRSETLWSAIKTILWHRLTCDFFESLTTQLPVTCHSFEMELVYFEQIRN